MSPPSEDARSPLEAFQLAFTKDVEARTVRPLPDYLARFPGAEEAISEVYAAFLIAGSRAIRSEPEPAAPEDRIAHYRVLRQIGSGAQGTVYLAEDMRLHRQVALKVLDSNRVIDPTLLDRFRREAEITSRLDNPGICAVYDSGQDRGVFWIAMRYVEGESLSAMISTAKEPDPTATTSIFESLESVDRDTPVALEASERTAPAGPASRTEIMRVVALVEMIARALHAAHEAGVIHRDIKPGNVIVTKKGDPVILDFGLAQEVAAEETTLTVTGALLGTPAYMSPEQIAAHRIRLDRRTDVYSLGVSLFECLTLKRPFDAPTRDRLYYAILTKEAPDVRALNPAIPADLRVVVATALEKDRERRYQTALDLAEDLRRVRMHEPIAAKPAGRLVRLGRWAQRNPGVATALGGFIAAITAALTLALLYLGQARAETERERARLRAARLQSITARVREAMTDDPWTAVRLLREIPDAEGFRDAIQASLHLRDHVLPLRVHHEKDGGINSAVLSPDGRRVAIATDGGAVRILEVEGSAEPHTLEVKRSGELRVAYSPDGQHLVVVSDMDAEAWLWTPADAATPRRLAGHRNGIESVTFSADGRWMATGSKDHTARLWNLARPGDSLACMGHEGPVNSLEFSPDASKLVTASEDSTARVWDTNNAGEVAVFREHTKRVTVAGFLDDRTVFTGSGDNTVRVWAIDQPSASVATHTQPESITSAYRLDDRRVLSASWDGTVHVWNREAPNQPTSAIAGMRHVTALSPDHKLVIGGWLEKVPRVAAVENLGSSVPLIGHGSSVSAFAFDRRGDRLVTASWEGSVAVWDVGDIRRMLSPENPPPPQPPPPRPQSGPSGPGPSEQAGIAGPPARPPLRMDTTQDGTVSIFKMSPDDRMVRVVPAQTASDARLAGSIELGSHDAPVTCAKFSPDAKRVVTGSSDATIRIWRLDRPDAPIILRGSVGPVTSAAFSPDASTLAACFGDEMVYVWNLAQESQSARHLPWRNRTREQVTRLSFSPDGRRIMAESQEWIARIWDLGRDEEPITIRDPMGDNTCVAEFATFSGDGSTIRSSSGRSWLIDWPTIRRRLWSRLAGADVEQRRALLGFEPFEHPPLALPSGR
jgi:WD40 repeat protein/serine/threonine protein kinase